jgi:2-oxoisovalerate dehydrogenase E1 component
LSGRIATDFWQFLDAPVKVIGAENLPAVPLNIDLEKEMLPNNEKVYQGLANLLAY